MNWLRRAMIGRYGVDQLGCALVVLYVFLCLLAQVLHNSLLSLLSLVCVAWAFYRMFSRRLEQRRYENCRFLELIGPAVRRYRVNKFRRNDKEHCYFRCPNCGQQLRVPKGKGKISITCRNCGVSFEEKT